MKTVRLEVRRPSGWETVTVEDISKLTVAGAPGSQDRAVQFTLIGHREGAPNQIESEVLDVAERHEPLLDTAFPRTDTGESLALASELQD